MTPIAKRKMERKKTFNDFIANKHLKSTKQRDIIFDEFFNNFMGKHVTIEELYESLKENHPSIGFATVYRTLKLFKESGIASELHFGDGKARYEPVRSETADHHHMVCTQCGSIMEFANMQIESCLMQIAKLNEFDVSNHKLEIYGLCSDCREQK
ncbi:MAG: transcriptional repressor [Thermodesulfobacteriota bacterium]